MAHLSQNIAPLTFSQWQQQQRYADVHGVSESAYLQYLKEWYRSKDLVQKNIKDGLKADFVQLLKDLNFLFPQNESDKFVKDINYDNDEDLILAIPHFAKKLKDVAKLLNNKRESVKRAKNKHNLIGSNIGVESLLYEYVLKTFTQKEGTAVQVPALTLQSLLPELSAVQDNFFIEVEELHDPNTYHDSDPSVNVTEYQDYSHIENLLPLRDDSNPFTEEEILNVISSRFLSKAAPTPLFKTFVDYLYNTAVNPSESAYWKDKVDALISANEKYLGETVYGLTAIRLDEVTQPDYLLLLNFIKGDNWFLWPSGHQQLNNTTYNNTFEPLELVNSNFQQSGGTYGYDYTVSDLIFTDKNGSVEGAWLQGPYTTTTYGKTQISLKGGEISEFLFPYVGYNISPRSLVFESFNLTRNNEKFFNSLSTPQQEKILSSYYTSQFPLSASDNLYLNQTTLISQGAVAGKFSDEADVIAVKTHTFEKPATYSDENSGSTEMAYAYKFDRTDLPIKIGSNNIQWPIQTFDAQDNLSLTFTQEDCLPIRLVELNSSYTMAGAVASQDITTSDVIYKLNSRGSMDQAVEAAWLGSEPISHLNKYYQDIMVYGMLSAVQCAHAIEGSIQNSLAFKTKPGSKVSFVWCGVDTFADEVFKYVPHERNCPYGNSYPHDYYINQDYINPSSASDKSYWKKCNCKSVNYSPIGHKGLKVTDYNGVADYLFADPFGLGESFTLGSWIDTRGFTVKDSPQFSFYQLDGQEGDGSVGFGTGRWKTSNGTLTEIGDRMVLKTGKRYTYYRTNLRTNADSGSGNTVSASLPPYLITNYIYKKLNAVMCDSQGVKYDIVIALDYSRSMSFDFEKLKAMVGKICTRVINACTPTASKDVQCYSRSNTVQVAIVAFAEKAITVNCLTNGEYELNLQVNSLQRPTEYSAFTTNIKAALDTCDYLLNTDTSNGGKPLLDLKTLCSQINVAITNESNLTGFLNIPQKNAKQKIVIISDGKANIDDDLTLSKAKALKDKGIEILAIDMGELSLSNEVMEEMASSEYSYFSLYRYLVSGDGDYDGFVDYISPRIDGCVPFYPTWRKAEKDADGVWRSTKQISNMVLRPNDYLMYTHQSSVTYNDLFNGSRFQQPSVCFTINVKLDGWDYETSSFSTLNVGSKYGAKPFWAVVPNNPIPIAGQIRFVEEYLPVHQPETSVMVLKNASFVQYIRYGYSDLKWNQPLSFTETHDSIRWNKINFIKKLSNLESLMRSDKMDLIAESSFEPSDMVLESFSEYRPARYHYVARADFNYTEKLYLRSKCITSYTTFYSGVVIEPKEPYANLDNKFFPTVATVAFPETFVTERKVGGYMLPENLGVTSYRGKGYVYSLDKNSLSSLDAAAVDRVFLDIEKYGARNRGLTKKDQLSPVVLEKIDNKWIMEPYGSGAKAGVILGTKENQKFTPYQSSYEILGYNSHGVSRQQDNFQFWDLQEDQATWNDKTSQKNYRKELNTEAYGVRLNKLLANKGTMVQWKADIYGNDFGLYKQLPSEVIQIKKIPPSVIFQTASALEINLGTYNMLTVVADGDKPFSYQWYKDGSPLIGGNMPNYKIYKSVPSTSGSYVCEISNLVGITSSVPILITFNPNDAGNFISSELEDLLSDDTNKPISWF